MLTAPESLAAALRNDETVLVKSLSAESSDLGDARWSYALIAEVDVPSTADQPKLAVPERIPMMGGELQ